MKKYFIIAGALAALVVPSAALADVSTNGTTNAYGWCQANHLANFNGDSNGIGHIRSTMTGEKIASEAGNRAPALCADLQGQFAPISNNG